MAGLFGAIASGVGVAQALHGIMKSRNLVQDEELQAMMNRLSNVRVSIDSNRTYGEQKIAQRTIMQVENNTLQIDT